MSGWTEAGPLLAEPLPSARKLILNRPSLSTSAALGWGPTLAAGRYSPGQILIRPLDLCSLIWLLLLLLLVMLILDDGVGLVRSLRKVIIWPSANTTMSAGLVGRF